MRAQVVHRVIHNRGWTHLDRRPVRLLPSTADEAPGRGRRRSQGEGKRRTGWPRAFSLSSDPPEDRRTTLARRPDALLQILAGQRRRLGQRLELDARLEVAVPAVEQRQLRVAAGDRRGARDALGGRQDLLLERIPLD